ncbi:MAG: gfo 1 [Herbinix sp.]|jgi:predicted dehydrogenase|nr:gfo 1 [Herbinix sp.]
MKKLRIGIIGCGRISSVYRDAFLKLEDLIEVVVAVDKDIERAKRFSDDFPGCIFADNLTSVITSATIDVMHVLTPHFLHKDHVIQCLEAGINVLTEKPIAISMEDAYEMCAVARKTGKKLGVIFQNRYIDGIVHAKKMLLEGRMGKITGAWSSLNWWRPPSYYECDWKGTWEKEGGGVVIDQAIHSIDLVRYLMDCEVKSVKGHIDTRILSHIEVEDVADAAITFENGAVYSFYACNYFTANSLIQIMVSTEKGTISLSGDTVTIHLDGKDTVIENSSDAGREEHAYWGKCHLDQIKDYYNCLLKNRPVPIAPEDATKTLEIVLAIYQSSREGREITKTK